MSFSIKLSERYIDLKQACEEINPKLYEPLSWILILNLQLIPEEDIKGNDKLSLSYNLMNSNTEKALAIVKKLAAADTKMSKYYKHLLEIDPELKQTQEVSTKFFNFSKRRIEFTKEHGIKAY